MEARLTRGRRLIWGIPAGAGQRPATGGSCLLLPVDLPRSPTPSSGSSEACDIATSLQDGRGVVREVHGTSAEAVWDASGPGTHIVQKINDSCSLKKNLPI